jgi:hypothetical protein
VPNGTYYIEVIASPAKVLPEITTRNDVSFRKIILAVRPATALPASGNRAI